MGHLEDLREWASRLGSYDQMLLDLADVLHWSEFPGTPNTLVTSCKELPLQTLCNLSVNGMKRIYSERHYFSSRCEVCHYVHGVVKRLEGKD